MRQLPTFYYLDHLLSVMDEVESLSGHLLRDPHRLFIGDFRSLPRLTQATWARMAGRKGRFFKEAQLQYDELDDLPGRLQELARCGFARALGPDDLPGCLRERTKPELLAHLRSLGSAPTFRVSWSKERLLEALSEGFRSSSREAVQRSLEDLGLIAQERIQELRFITFLFFGRFAPDLRAITLRDLGLMRAHALGGERSAPFLCADEAAAAFFYEHGRHVFREGDEVARDALGSQLLRWPMHRSDAVERRREALLYCFGGRCEKASNPEGALDFYERSGAPASRERAVRIRYALGQHESVARRLKGMIDAPLSDEECAFAADFYARKFGGKRTSQATDLLRAGERIEIDEAFRHEPERAVGRHFEALGHRALFGENRLWHMLFGVVFWERLLGPDARGFHGDFQGLPSSLRERSFHLAEEEFIERSLGELRTQEGARSLVARTFGAAYGTENGLFGWDWFEETDLAAVLGSRSRDGVAAALGAMAEDFPGRRSGYPDLVLIGGDGSLRFVEVKAEGDSVRRKQLVRMEQLRGFGLDAAILGVDWGLDPNRTYTVVDIETTGRRAPQHRVTEIAAVRIRGGEVIDTWTTLVNPDRPIPPGITRLTGISDSMVRDAPRFEDVASALEAFLEGSIFVAHNVGFDYGFLSDEFGRLDQSFMHPKLCTVVSMRRYFPGSRSYSLGNLAREYGIALRHHHRALDDALATVELLKMVHGARLGAESAVRDSLLDSEDSDRQ